MAGPNRKPNNSGNYFTQQIQKNGVNFIDGMRDDILQRDSIRIFRDLSRGNINVEQYGDYFLNPKLLNAAITAAYSKYMLSSTSKAGVELLMAKPNVNIDYPSAPSVLDFHSRASEGYSLILQAMMNIKQSNDIGYLFSLANNLGGYRNYI